jgi:drug/metabolite transporter (DMT)-like permease
MNAELPLGPRAAVTADGRGGEIGQLTLYALMCAVWGSSFFFTAIALRGFNATSLPALRMVLATAALAVVVRARRLPLPREPVVWAHLAVLGVFNIALPYLLLTWAQLHVNSSTASILSATTPLFVFIFSWLVVRTEAFSALRAAGLVLAFLGVVALYGADHTSARDVGPWSLAIVLCSMMYAAGNVYTRRFVPGVHPFVIALLQIGIGAFCLVAFGVATGTLSAATDNPAAWLALLELGLAGSALTYLLFFHFLRRWGSTATSLNTYFQPIVGLGLGVVVLHDSITLTGWLALGVVMLGIALFGWSAARRLAATGPRHTLPTHPEKLSP